MFLFGAIWGVALGGTAIVVNQNYEAFKAFTDADNAVIALGILAFIIGSLFIIFVMVLSGVLQSLAGRKLPRRWMTLWGVGIGAACASLTLQLAPITL